MVYWRAFDCSATVVPTHKYFNGVTRIVNTYRDVNIVTYSVNFTTVYWRWKCRVLIINEDIVCVMWYPRILMIEGIWLNCDITTCYIAFYCEYRCTPRLCVVSFIIYVLHIVLKKCTNSILMSSGLWVNVGRKFSFSVLLFKICVWTRQENICFNYNASVMYNSVLYAVAMFRLID